jgi:uncharacterized protein YabN with tetrapyrrole methylase and pyrophosphatase domain
MSVENFAAATPGERSQGALVVVGTGIQWGGQATIAAETAIKRADCVLFAVADPWAARWIRDLRPTAESLPYPRDGRPRKAIYLAMVDRILAELRGGRKVCAAFYGSPSLLNAPAHAAIERARREGFSARMLPGVSSLECLFSDVGLDPGADGCQVFEASDFLVRKRVFDSYTHLVLCQIAVIGTAEAFDPANVARIRHGLALLAERLGTTYPEHHEVVIYEAASQPLSGPRADRVRLVDLPSIELTEISTLYVPPVGPAPIDTEMIARLAAPVAAPRAVAPLTRPQ